MIARLSFNTACELGFRGSLDEWERLMGQLRRGERAIFSAGKDAPRIGFPLLFRRVKARGCGLTRRGFIALRNSTYIGRPIRELLRFDLKRYGADPIPPFACPAGPAKSCSALIPLG